jgi:hypothetical protein
MDIFNICLIKCSRLGFSPSLVPTGLHQFVITVHAYHAVELNPRPFNADVANVGIGLWLQDKGTPTGKAVSKQPGLMAQCIAMAS